MNKGFIYVASNQKLFYELALYSAESLRDIHPDADITLFTHENWVDKRAELLFNKIITKIPVHARAKMWCMARTPYDQTLYIDVDSQIVRKINGVFEEIEKSDIMFTEPIWYAASDYRYSFIDKEQTILPPYHGAVCCFHKRDLVLDFMQTWFEEYHKQTTNEEWPYEDFADKLWKNFDMFTLWRMTCGSFEEFNRFSDLKISLGSRIYNSTIHDGRSLPKKPVILQIDKKTITENMPFLYEKILKGLKDERSLPEKPKNSKDLIFYN